MHSKLIVRICIHGSSTPSVTLFSYYSAVFITCTCNNTNTIITNITITIIIIVHSPLVSIVEAIIVVVVFVVNATVVPYVICVLVVKLQDKVEIPLASPNNVFCSLPQRLQVRFKLWISNSFNTIPLFSLKATTMVALWWVSQLPETTSCFHFNNLVQRNSCLCLYGDIH